MDVCIDIQPAVTQKAGIGRYVSELVANLPSGDGLNFDLFYFDFKGKACPPPSHVGRLKPFRALPGTLIQQAWKRLGWPRFDTLAGAADLYHFTNFIIPPISPSAKALVSIHDISFILHPEFTEAQNLDYLSRRIGLTTKRADGVITISKQSAADLTERLGVPEEKIFPIHLGVSAAFKKADDEAVRATMGELEIQKPYILMVGTFEPRKNIQFAVDIFEKMDYFDGDLVIVGQKGWNNEAIFERIEDSSARGRIRTFTAVPDEHLVQLYSGAEFLLMTSLYEGFGFPPIEAMACSTPVLTSSGGSLAEVCGDAAIVVNGYDSEEWLENARRILHDSDLRSELAAKGETQAARYSWQKTAQEHVEAYRKVLA